MILKEHVMRFCEFFFFFAGCLWLADSVECKLAGWVEAYWQLVLRLVDLQ